MNSPLRHRAGRQALATALTLAGSAAGLVGWSRLAVDRRMPLPPALPGRHERLATRRAGAVSLYGAAEAAGVPLLLIHSINAAANAYEVRPLYLHYTRGRVKCEIGLAKGKKLFDKRETEKNRDWQREKARLMREKA